MLCSPTYNITVTQIQLGTTLIDVDLTALFDTGISFTYLAYPTYTKLSENVSDWHYTFSFAYILSVELSSSPLLQFHSQIKDRRRPPDPKIPFEYGYDARSY